MNLGGCESTGQKRQALVNIENIVGARPLNQFLRLAVIAGVESAVQIHIERGDNLNARDASGMTPLMLAATRNKPEICKLLLRAGADHDLLDPSGKTALEIAIAAGSNATAAVLATVQVPTPNLPSTNIALDTEPELIAPPSLFSSIFAEADTSVELEVVTVPTRPEVPAKLPAPEAHTPSETVNDEIDDGEFDLSGWDAEIEPTRPEADLGIIDSASAIQTAITAHEPIDTSTEWDDTDVYLPEVALPLARADDREGHATLRRLLLRAIREGSVPALDVQAQSTNEDRSVNPEAVAYLTMVINDLGAEVDERFEYSDAFENFEVFVDPEETPDEEEILDEALVAIDRAASPRHEPLRIYLREFQRWQLLTAEEEVQLAKDMEVALNLALDALATWHDGIERTLAAGTEAVSGARQFTSICVNGEFESEPSSVENFETEALAQVKPKGAADDTEELEDDELADAGEATFAVALGRLASLVDREGSPRASFYEVRQALAGLHLNRRFLLELIDAANGPVPCPKFRDAMVNFRKARDRMAEANLKLPFFLAKKYLYSGEPLDDLAQEGNIGLLKAIDRYDWRRGFRFSTYATWWIRQQISRYVADKVRIIRVPVHIHEKLQRTDRLAQDFETTVGREPTLDELAERMEMPSHKVAALLRISPEPSSIYELTVDGMIAIDAHDAHASPDPADVIDKIQLNRALDNFISALSTKDRKEELILRLRFGIGVDEALTLDEIGMRFAVTRERIRQIEAKAIRKLQHPSRSEPFARMALGLWPAEIPPASAKCTSVGGNESGTGRSGVQSPTPKRLAALSPPLEAVQSAGSSNPSPSALDRILVQASEMGIRVFDGRQSTGKIWVKLLEPQDGAQRRFVRKLLEIGFTFSPGKGYWQ